LKIIAQLPLGSFLQAPAPRPKGYWQPAVSPRE
jgi:hypothetical protein